MYLEYFGFKRLPFTISPDPDFLFPSSGHQEALAHLNYAFTDQGGLICLTGEVGTGKTTLCRALMSQLPKDIRLAYIFNPQLSPIELLENICDELNIKYEEGLSLKSLYSLLNKKLLKIYSNNKKVVCVIDEAQVMTAPLLEQIRLLTNLETNREKLMTLVLVGQPELREILERHDLRQLSQRITARYHLDCLNLDDTQTYLQHRMACASTQPAVNENLFTKAAVKQLWKLSRGVPRLINSIADRALLGAYALERKQIDKSIIEQAAKEVLGEPYEASGQQHRPATQYRLQFGFIFLGLFLMAASLFLFSERPYFLAKEGLNSLQSSLETPLPSSSAQLEQTPDVEGEPTKSSNSVVNNPVALVSQSIGASFDSCEELNVPSYQCVWVSWPYADLQEIRQPVAIKNVSGQWQMLANETLESASNYAGEALILWLMPIGYNDLIFPGNTSPVVRWVRGELGVTWPQDWTSIGPNGVQVDFNPEFYDPLLEQSVAEFQLANGLKPDRILGPRTLMHMQALAE